MKVIMCFMVKRSLESDGITVFVCEGKLSVFQLDCQFIQGKIRAFDLLKY